MTFPWRFVKVNACDYLQEVVLAQMTTTTMIRVINRNLPLHHRKDYLRYLDLYHNLT